MGRFEDGDEGEKSREERHDGRREGQKEVGWWLRRVEGYGGGRVYLIGDPGGTPLPEA